MPETMERSLMKYADEGQAIARELKLPPATAEAEAAMMQAACKRRNKPVAEIAAEKARVLGRASRRQDYIANGSNPAPAIADGVAERDPRAEYRARKAEQKRQRYQNDPEYRARKVEKQRLRRQDPVYRAHMNEQHRLRRQRSKAVQSR